MNKPIAKIPYRNPKETHYHKDKKKKKSKIERRYDMTDIMVLNQ